MKPNWYFNVNKEFLVLTFSTSWNVCRERDRRDHQTDLHHLPAALILLLMFNLTAFSILYEHFYKNVFFNCFFHITLTSDKINQLFLTLFKDFLCLKIFLRKWRFSLISLDLRASKPTKLIPAWFVHSWTFQYIFIKSGFFHRATSWLQSRRSSETGIRPDLDLISYCK